MRLAPNVKALREVLKKDSPARRTLREKVPTTTLRRHAKGEDLPASEWLVLYFVVFGMYPQNWLPERQRKAYVRIAEKLAAANQEAQANQ
jgi:hypothetical protein